ncbi:DUF4468 domain-containing protein [Pontiella agarivorans]|uniref:DUF4468 domain-containing protein n=1 Tax=Pontiella agarivorans TaxID=3038953 RepID=A0ABU5MWG3_9BACT|nr:DUF4468 domain-containing protein [Pontiella agarivorans]MDZ8118492.1 DUF4468 domain-containing protein [Pontiella agarivorans]
MKKIYITLTVIASLLFSGCETTSISPADTDRADLQYVVTLTDHSSEDIYTGLKLWVAENLKSAKAVIDYEDKEKGIIICNGIVPNIILKSGLSSIALQAEFKMKIEVKEGKARFTFSDYGIVGRHSSTLYESEVSQIDTKLKAFETSIVEYLNAKPNNDF